MYEELKCEAPERNVRTIADTMRSAAENLRVLLEQEATILRFLTGPKEEPENVSRGPECLMDEVEMVNRLSDAALANVVKIREILGAG